MHSFSINAHTCSVQKLLLIKYVCVACVSMWVCLCILCLFAHFFIFFLSPSHTLSFGPFSSHFPLCRSVYRAVRYQFINHNHSNSLWLANYLTNTSDTSKSIGPFIYSNLSLGFVSLVFSGEFNFFRISFWSIFNFYRFFPNGNFVNPIEIEKEKETGETVPNATIDWMASVNICSPGVCMFYEECVRARLCVVLYTHIYPGSEINQYVSNWLGSLFTQWNNFQNIDIGFPMHNVCIWNVKDATLHI